MSHPVPAVIVLLGLLVFVHEFGHFIVGRAAGIAVEIFSIGFGPRLLGFSWRGTMYQLCAIPLGGFVKFAGAAPGEEVPHGLKGIAFKEASLGKRAATVVAGPMANFLLAAIAFSVLGFEGVPHPPALIGEVIEGSRAEAAGIQPGDRMTAIDGQSIEKWRDLEQIISKSPEKTLAVTVDRAGQKVTLSLTPAATETKNIFGKTSRIGRAGIALGMLPPVIRVLASDSPASGAGLKTGDRILSVIWNGQKKDIKSYPEFQANIVSLATNPDGPSDITLEVVSYSHDSETNEPAPKGPEEMKREIKLSLLPVRASKAANSSQETGSSEGRQLMRALGVSDGQLTVGELPAEDGRPNPAAGALKAGDTLLAMDGKPLKDLFALREALMANSSQVVPFKIMRNFEEITVPVSLEGVETQKPEGVSTVYILPVVFMGSPIEPEPLYEVYKNPFSAVLYGIKETGRQTAELTANVVQLITGEVPLKALGGPMLIAKVAGESARRGWQTFLGSMALISVNLGLLNLFPIPVLDGGQLVMMGVEGIRRRPLSEVAIENFQKIGFAMIMCLVVLATYNDLSRFWKSMLSSVVGIFQ